MNQTFLEVSWSKCKDKMQAYTHLIGEYTPGLDQKNDYKVGEFKFDLEIFDNNSFIMDFEAGVEHLYNAAKKGLSCVKKESWEIKNGGEDLKDKRLLVFHLLPSNATQLPRGSGFEPGTKPKCDLFIRFNKPDYEFLYVPPPTTSTVTTTTKTTAAGTQQGNTTPTPTAKVQEVKDSEKVSKVWIVIIVIIVEVVVVIGVGFSVWYYMAKNKRN
ncbi:unnamed protein product [Meloidogyne enterolobii]|uniref:Uncharacterized protein n=1 Tax=Meloidogyne enterolobii TaxID=390850 RepID=A0ACB0YY12_MELEN